MHGLEAADHDEALDDDAAGRHRASSPRRRLVLRVAIVLGALVVAAGLGLVAASAIGLTHPSTGPTYAAAKDRPDVLPVDPEFGRTIDIDQQSSRATRPAPSATAPAPAPIVQRPTARPAPVTTTSAAARPTVERSPQPPRAAPAVRLGKLCPAAGATGVTAGGQRAVCMQGRGGHTRWQRA